jgi:hypothetical protein
MGFMVDSVTLGQVFLQVLQFSRASIIRQWLSVLMYHLGDEDGQSSETYFHPINMNNMNACFPPKHVIIGEQQCKISAMLCVALFELFPVICTPLNVSVSTTGFIYYLK